MFITPDSPAKTPDGCTPRSGNYWTLFTPAIWKVLHAVSQIEDADAIDDDVAESLEWVPDDWQKPLRNFLNSKCGMGSGEKFFDLYEIHNYNHAAEILIHAYPAEFIELAKVLPDQTALL
jgi:hypothetical protein